MGLYDHATTPGSTRQHSHTVLLPSTTIKGTAPSRPTIRFDHNPAVQTPPPPGSTGVTTFGANVTKPLRSVAEVVYDATPLNNITDVASAIKEGGNRPLLPPGLKARIARGVPQGATGLNRAWARIRARRQVMPVGRE